MRLRLQVASGYNLLQSKLYLNMHPVSKCNFFYMFQDYVATCIVAMNSGLCDKSIVASCQFT